MKLRFVPGKDSTSFLLVESGNKKDLFSLRGEKLFTVAHDDIQYIGEGLFAVSKKEKKGLLNWQGKVLLPVEYDAIGSATNGVISLLKNMKFGLYDIKAKKLVKPAYDKNLVPYSTGWVTAFRDGAYGFIDWNGKPVTAFRFQEVQFWNDTTALVKENGNMFLFKILTERESYNGIKSIDYIQDTPTEKIAIMRQGNLYGVLSSKRGVIIPLVFSDLVNVGSKEEPLFFTEKHVEEAAVFVVIYYDQTGRFLRREIYEGPDDYEKIYCPDN